MLTDAQCQVIDQHLMEDVEPRKVAAFLCLHMGLLLGEVTALRRQDIDLAAGMIYIRYVAGRGKGGTASDPVEFLPSDAPRDLPMPLSVKLFLSANIGLYPSGDCFILNGEKHLPPFRLMQVLLSTMNEKYQIADKLSSMELRYAFIRQKLEAGVDMYSLCTYLGQNKRPDVIVKRFSEYCRVDLAAVAFSEIGQTEYQRCNAPRQMNLLILGAGGQGQVVKETAEAIDVFEHIAFLDDDTTLPGVLDSLGNCQRYRNDYPMAFVAIGNNELRCKLINHLQMTGFIVPVLKHPTATISPAVEAGAGTIFEAKTIVNPAVKIGKGVILSSASIVEHGAVIHDYSHVEAGTIIRKGMIIPAGMRVNNINLNELNSAQNAG